MARQLTVLALALLASGICRAAEPPIDRLVVGGDAAYPPFEWLDEEGRPEGFNVELMRMLAESAGVEVEFRLGDWPETLAALETGEVDVVPMFVSDQRRRQYRFTNIYVYQTHALFARPDRSPLDGVDSVGDSRLVVEAGSNAQTELRQRYPDFLPELTANTREALRMVADGNADYALLAAPVAQELIEREGWRIQRKSPPMWPRGYAFAVHRDRPELSAWLQSRLVEAISDGRYLELYNRWSHRIEPGRDASADYLRTALIALAVVVLAIVIFAVWNFSLRRQVAERTSEVVQELDHRREAERQARDMARREPITGLYNARYFCGKCGELAGSPPMRAVS